MHRSFFENVKCFRSLIAENRRRMKIFWMRQKEIGVGLVTWINKMIRLIIISKYHQKYWQLPKMINALCVLFSQKFERKWTAEPLWCSYVARWRMNRKGKQLEKKWKKWEREKKNTTDNSTKFIILFYVWRLNLWNSICFCSSDCCFFFLRSFNSSCQQNVSFPSESCVCVAVCDFGLKHERTYSMINWFLILIKNRPKLASYQSIVYHLLFGPFWFKCRLCHWIAWEILRLASWIIPLWIFDWQNHDSFFILFFICTFALRTLRWKIPLFTF